MNENDNHQGTIYHPIQSVEMSKDTNTIVDLHDLRNDIECIKFVSTSTCVVFNFNMLVASLFCIFV